MTVDAREPDADDPADDSGPSAEFVQAFTRHQRRVYLFILAQVFHPSDAEEILQETNVIILRKWKQFEPGTNFFAWASRIAFYEVKKFRDRRRRDRLRFSDEFVETVSTEIAEHGEEFESRRLALLHCLQKLRPVDRKIIQARYAPESSGQDIAAELGRPANSVYQAISRIRRTLMECIQRRLAAEGTR